ncbi:uncharacterized protein LOC134264293 [Saccostrea cucullata]|uniref:uncharacterized protein LOC134264293 n=1 Tax=Saccostrea cuccullata TaxID=36930 RepID=UPI002ED13D65
MMTLLEFSAGLMIFCQLPPCYIFKTQLCREANASLKYVQRCPRSRMEYRQRSLIKGCSAIPYESCSMGPFEYHCVPDHERRRLLEVCAPKVLITGRHCSQFNVGIGQVIEDIKKCDICPFNYDSTEGFKYCVHFQTTIKPPADVNTSEVLSNLSQQAYHLLSAALTNKTKSSYKRDSSESSSVCKIVKGCHHLATCTNKDTKFH